MDGPHAFESSLLSHKYIFLAYPHATANTVPKKTETVSQSVITTLLPTEHMVPKHSDLLYERAMESQHLVVSSGRARTSG